jgi:septum formation protein
MDDQFLIEYCMSVSCPLILASQSLQRQKLFAALGFAFESIPADIDELAIDHPDHEIRAAMVAVAKAKKIQGDNPEAVIVSADTFVVLDGKRLEKPESVAAAQQMLHQLSGQAFTVYTGWAVLDGTKSFQESGTSIISVQFRSLSAIEVEKYTQTQPVTTWAGGFSIKNEAGIALISKIEGSLTGLLGIPVEIVQPILISLMGQDSGL